MIHCTSFLGRRIFGIDTTLPEPRKADQEATARNNADPYDINEKAPCEENDPGEKEEPTYVEEDVGGCRKIFV